MNPRRTIRIAMLAALTAVAAHVCIPVPPVPATLQTVVTLVSGAVLGPRDGALSQIVYITLGLLGFPVFAGGGAGAGWLVGPTGGYLVGFVVCPLIVGSLLGDRRAPHAGSRATAARIAAAMLAGTLTIHSLGALWLSLSTGIRLGAALVAGFVPFVVVDAAKIALATWLARAVRAHPTFAE